MSAPLTATRAPDDMVAGTPGEEATVPTSRRTRWGAPTWALAGGVVAVWVVVSVLADGSNTLYLPGLGRTGFHDYFSDLKVDLIRGRDTNVVMQVVGALSDVFNAAVGWLQDVFSRADLPRPVPQVGYLGVLGIAGWCTLAVAGWRLAVAVEVGLVAVGLLGYWADSLDTLIVTFFAVGIALLIGMPLAIWIGCSRLARTVATPVLDVLQTMPAFVYLAPFALFFSIGPAIAVAVTVLYALPPAVRIAAHGIQMVSRTTIEATDSLGQTRWQRLAKVQLPMARKTIIVGVNQTIMAALSMVVIAGFVNSPGLGQPVLEALAAGRVGSALTSGLCIVILAILLDRVTTEASERSETLARSGGRGRAHWIGLGVAAVVALVMVYLSRLELRFAEFPTTSLGGTIASAVDSFAGWVTDHIGGVTTAIQRGTTNGLLNPLQDLIAGSPWFVTGTALLLLAGVLAGVRGALSTAVCLGGIYMTGLWYDAMVTLTSVLVATVFVMILAVVLGVWMARSRVVERALRPLLDAAQVMPPFVYLIPVLLLFDPTRFTAIFAAVVYAAPVAIKLVADGVKQVPEATIEAATAAGSTPWQLITKVQLPMARGHLVLAANQGLLYVLAMVVIGGLVGGGALGYDVVLGFSQNEYFGKGVAAGIAIVLLGVMVDRVARRAAETSGTSRSGAT